MSAKLIALVLAGATALSACGDPVAGPETPSRPETPSPRAVKFWEAGSSVAWNQIARDLVLKYRSGYNGWRLFANLGLAQYNALIDVSASGRRGAPAADAGAVAGASAAWLAYFYPAEAAFLEAKVDEQAALGWPGARHPDFEAGEAIGRRVAAQVIQRAETDRFNAPWTGTVPDCAWCWFNDTMPPTAATLGQAKTFFLSSGSQFRLGPHPAWGSAKFLADLAEVRRISDTRTAEQDSIAKFWAAPFGNTSNAYFNRVTSELAVRYHLTERRTAHALALVSMAGYDAIVSSHDSKFTYWLLRPSMADPAITLAVPLPNFPGYPSNQAVYSWAAATVLAALFPSERQSLEADAAQSSESRIYAGLHFRFELDSGKVLGRKVARFALAHDVNGHEPFVLR
jgi:hypothetical protein